jgi:hypothetical protein
MTSTFRLAVAFSCLAGLAFMSFGCGSGSAEANPCATPGATYLFHLVEHPGGTCGPVPDEIVNVDSDGTTSTSVSCDDITQDGCTARNTGCMSSMNGVDCSVTTDVTFAKDGSGATGLETATCSNSSASCTSTYDVTATRR